MARSSFTERQYECVLCGARFTALTGIPPADPVCMDCGLRHSTTKLKELIRQKRERQGR